MQRNSLTDGEDGLHDRIESNCIVKFYNWKTFTLSSPGNKSYIQT